MVSEEGARISVCMTKQTVVESNKINSEKIGIEFLVPLNRTISVVYAFYI